MNWEHAFMNPMLMAMTFQMAAFQLLADPRNYRATKTKGLPVTSNIIQLHERNGEKK